MLFTRALFVSALALLANAQLQVTTISLSPAEATEAAYDLSSYLSKLSTETGYAAAESVLSTAAPLSDELAFFSGYLTATALPSWYTAMPTSVQNFWSSVRAAEISILTEAADSPAPTNGVKVAGAALAAAGAALAVM